MAEKAESKIVAVKVSCPLCGKIFPEISRQLFDIARLPINILLKKTCSKCKGSINQRYWTEGDINGEIYLYIGNRDNPSHQITTLSGMLTTNGQLDPKKLKIFKRQGLKMDIFNSMDEAERARINDF
ncbi:MAG: hypothetical protein Q8R55_00360 [Candidatus Taylorbacteria bacterium]|nr:hypothetical protein [Candidatus Taylorbacteria bacterium]